MTREEKFLLNHKIFDGVLHRKCSKCNEWYPENIEYFYLRNKSNPERGFNSECKECSVKRSQATNAKIPEETRIEKRKLSYQLNKEIENQNSRKWREENPEHKQAYQTEYQKKNPDKMRRYRINKRLHSTHDINNNEWEACKFYFNHRCAYCGLAIEDHYNIYAKKLRWEDLQQEHVIHKGGNELTNCIPSCKSCNDKKWEYDLDEWYNINNIKFVQERYNKIIKWLMEDCFKYIAKKKPKSKYNKNKV